MSSDLSASTGPSSASSLTTVDIEVVVQQVLSRTSTALSVTSSKHPWFFHTACCNHMTLEHIPSLFTLLMELRSLLDIKEQSILLVYPLVTLYIFQSCPSYIGHMFEVHDLKIPSQVVSVAATTATSSLDLWHVYVIHPYLVFSC